MNLENEVITGEWRDGRLHGQGVRKLANGELYAGEWMRGKLQGYGEHISKEESYVGHFSNNLENGKGKKISYASEQDGQHGYVYEGQFKDGLFEGQGRQEYENGDLYNGGFR